MKTEISTQRRKSRIANAVFFFISGFGYAAWASRIPTIRQELHLSDSMLGTLFFAMPVGLICTLPLTNYLLSRYSSPNLMLFGSLAFNSMLCVAGFVNSIWQLAILLFCFGCSRNLLNISMNAQAVNVQKLYKRSIITSFHGIWSMAGFSGAALGYLLVRLNVGRDWHFMMIGFCMAALTSYFIRFAIYEPVGVRTRKTLFSIPEKSLLKFAGIVFICMACENTMYDWSGVYFQKVMGASQQMATAAFAVYMVAMAVGRFTGDYVVNKIGIKKMLQYSALTLTLGFIAAVSFPFPITGFIGFLMAGFGISCISPLILSLVGKVSKRSNASALASISSVSYLGFLMVPPMIGFISEGLGIRFAFGIVACLAALMVLMIVRIEVDSAKVEEHTEEVLI